MSQITPYEAIYTYEKMHNPELPMVQEPIRPLNSFESFCMENEGTIFNPYGRVVPDTHRGQFRLGSKITTWTPPPPPAWKSIRPELPELTGDEWQDAWNEYQLLKNLNKTGQIEARLRFKNVQRYLHGKLNPKEMEMLKLGDYIANESLAFLFNPGMSVAMGILSDYWPRWFGGKANTFANYNRDVYWVPWHFFMGDDYINKVKNDLIANLFNEKAQDQLRFELRKIKKLGNQIVDFDFTAEDPLMWKKIAYQSRSVNFYWHPSAIFKPQYWAMGNFSMQALPKGTVIPLDGGGYRICVSDVYLHLHDTFNFAGSAPLAVWDTKNKKFPSLSWSMMKLFNSDFTGFRDKHGYGKDFTVLSPLYKVPGFEGKCFDVK